MPSENPLEPKPAESPPPEDTPLFCPQCDAPLEKKEEDIASCPQCNLSFFPTEPFVPVHCEGCGFMWETKEETETFCPECGQEVPWEKDAPAPPLDPLEVLEQHYDEVREIVPGQTWSVRDRESGEERTVFKPWDVSSAKEFFSLSNRFIPNVIEEIPQIQCLVLDQAIEKTLQQVLKRREPHQTLSILLQVGKIVHTLHAQGTILCFLEPTKIGLSHDLSPVFLAPMVTAKKGEHCTHSFLGNTFAPETLEGGIMGPSTDAYSLAVMILEALTGFSLPEDPVERGQILAMDKPYLVSLLAQSLKTNPMERYTDLRGLLERLEIFLEWMQTKKVEWDIAVESNIGRSPSRKTNQDSAGSLLLQNNFDSLPVEIAFFCVADGMGGGIKGEMASKIAVHRAQAHVLENRMLLGNGREVVTNLKTAVLKAQEGILQAQQGMGIFREGQMCTTFSGILVSGTRFGLAHVGDSRVYLYSHDQLHALTRDHSLVQQMVEDGEITREEARRHPQKNLVTQILGNEGISEYSIDDLSVTQDIELMELPEEGTFLLCSDGVWEAFPEQEIAVLLKRNASAKSLAKDLVEKAVKEDGSDNATAVVARFRVISQLEEQQGRFEWKAEKIVDISE